jgi:hypothetical protein
MPMRGRIWRLGGPVAFMTLVALTSGMQAQNDKPIHEG